MNNKYVVTNWMNNVKKLMSLNVVKKMLLVGPPGASKTSFAEHIAEENEFPLYELNITSGMYPEDVIYTLLPKGTEVMITKSALWKALESSNTRKTVLLLDEIDKGSARVEELLLRAFETYTIETPDGVLKGNKENLIIVATSNGYRDLMKPTYRRFDVRIPVELPDAETRKMIVKSILDETSVPVNNNLLTILDDIMQKAIKVLGADVGPSYIEISKIAEICYAMKDDEISNIEMLVDPLLNKNYGTEHLDIGFKYIKGIISKF